MRGREAGTVFKLAPTAGGIWIETVLYSFCPTDCSYGLSPWAGLTLDAAGNLYGATYYGGANGDGTAFELSPNANGTWTEMALHCFAGGIDGERPSSVDGSNDCSILASVRPTP